MFRDTEKEDAKMAADFSSIVESMASRSILYRFIIIGSIINLISWGSVLFLADWVHQIFSLLNTFSNKLPMAIMGIPLMSTAFAVYSLFRLKMQDVEDNPFDSSMMSTYNYQSRSLRQWWVWIASFAAGALNVLLLLLVDIWLNAGDLMDAIR